MGATLWYKYVLHYIISFPFFLKSESLRTELLLSELYIVDSFLSRCQVSIPRAFWHFGNFKASQSKGSWRPKFQSVTEFTFIAFCSTVQRFWRVSERTKKHEMGQIGKTNADDTEYMTWGSFRGFNGFNSWNLQTEKIWLRHTWVVATFSTAASINWSSELQHKSNFSRKWMRNM